MGNPLFGVNISKIIKDVVGPGVLPATLKKFTPGVRTPGNVTGGTNPTDASFPCRGFIDSQAVRFQDGTLVRAGNKVIVLIGDTINNGDPTSAPAPGDEITIESVAYKIPEDGHIDRDPAAATYTCEVRKL